MSNNDFLISSEIQVRRERATRGLAASRGGRSRSSWLRRLAAADPSVERRTR